MSRRLHFLSATKAFADRTRVRILAGLRGGELCVCELCDALQVTQSTLSTHLQVLRRAELVATRREGKWSYYAIATAAERPLGLLFEAFAESLAGDRTLRADARRLQKRLTLRDAGACCVGFSCTKSRRSTCAP